VVRAAFGASTPGAPVQNQLVWAFYFLLALRFLCGTAALGCVFVLPDCFFLYRVFLPFSIFGKISRTFLMSSSLQTRTRALPNSVTGGMGIFLSRM
jgi:hypothetical protein